MRTCQMAFPLTLASRRSQISGRQDVKFLNNLHTRSCKGVKVQNVDILLISRLQKTDAPDLLQTERSD